jgi:diguanylate cyclase (GGDEF)-like protein/PAS domain S-box-containing protein
MIERVISTPRKSLKIVWNSFGAFTMAIGIWAMHFVGMLALKFPIPIMYDVSTTILSIVPVFCACFSVMCLMTLKPYSNYRLLIGGVLLASGIGFMHHIGMAAIRLNAVMVHEVIFVYLSIIIALLLAIVALKIQYKVINQKHYQFINKGYLFSAVIMGLASSGMHYTSMAAVSFTPGNTSEIIDGVDSTALTLIVALVALILLILAILIPNLLRYKQLIITVSEDAARMCALMNTSQDALIQMDTNGNIVGWSPRAQVTFGWKNNEAIGQKLVNLIVPPRFHDLYEQHLSHFLTTSESAILDTMIEVEALHKEGHHFPTEVTISFINTANGFEFNAFARDISQRKKVEKTLIIANEELAFQNEENDKRANELMLAASVFSHAIEGIMITDAATTIIDVNNAFTKISGYSRQEVIGQSTRLLGSGIHPRQFYHEMRQIINTTDHWVGEIFNRHKSGAIYTTRMSVSAVKNTAGVTTHYVALMSDITQQNEHKSQLEQMAHYDPLTKLPNRTLLANRLNQAIVQCERDDKGLAVAFMDLDGFKNVNDTYGHAIGDELLIIVTQRMKNALREIDTLARIGGDEFIAVITNLAKNEDYKQTLERLLLTVSDPIEINEHILKVSVSIGVTLYPQDDADTDLLLRHCDQAMYLAKQAGKNCYHLFDSDYDDAINIKRESLNNIKKAFNNREFVLYYQPKVNMATGEVIGTEALIRWKHPKRGLLQPLDLLPIIENHPISLDIGVWVIDCALSQISQWQRMGITCPISVNISAYHLQQDDFAERLAILLAAHPDVLPHHLELEILETSAFSDINNTVSIMRTCIELGVKFALDDFGTGYSSLTYLRRLPASLIKIDQSFIRDMLTDPEDLAIVRGVVSLTNAFHLEVIAEGVESIEHGVALLKLGCELAQGYGVARPMPASDIPDWISNWKPDPTWQV